MDPFLKTMGKAMEKAVVVEEPEAEAEPEAEPEQDQELYNAETEYEDELEVEKFVFENTEYLKSKDNVVYDIETQDPISAWNEATNAIDMFE